MINDQDKINVNQVYSTKSNGGTRQKSKKRIKHTNDSKDKIDRSMSGSQRRLNLSNTSEMERIINGKPIRKDRSPDSGVRKVPKKNVFY